MFDGRWRTRVDRVTGPVGATLRRIGVTADHLTAVGLVMAVGTALAIGSGRLGLGLALLAASSLPDMLDGAVAKAAGTASPRGAFFDSVADRVTDSLVLGGVAWYLASTRGTRDAVLAMAVLAASLLVSYERAKAESLGYEAKGGLMERAERVAALWLGIAFSAVLVPVLWLMLALTLATAAQRFAKVWRQAPGPAGPRVAAASSGEGRWRAWRASAAQSRQHRGARAARRFSSRTSWRQWRMDAASREGRPSWRRRAGTRP